MLIDVGIASQLYNPRRATMHTSSPSKIRNADASTAIPSQRNTIYTPASTPAPSAVGEFKGWFANLFNWKAQQYVLHSVDNCLTTRDEVARLLETFGCAVTLEDAQGWGVLKCRVEEQYGQFIVSRSAFSVY